MTWMVDPPSGSGYERVYFHEEANAREYVEKEMPPRTRIVNLEQPTREWTKADPEYYRGADPSYDAIDVISNFGLDFDLGCAVKYILRAGKKPGNDFLTDLRKAHRVLERRIERIESFGK